MTLRVLLPFAVFLDRSDVVRIVAEGRSGAFGILPRRRDGVAALPPGILVVETLEQGENYVAVDEGVLVKTGREVRVSVRDALAGADLGELREAVEARFMSLDEHERSVRSVMEKLESGLIRRLAEFQHD
ncbi:F0F1 ATP synthase subunit epsilon [Guyparkeria hydrothermalis]|uniref:F0F1 ATP synthase subunit epsilon n=1 Tax=Guyparkeria hydrothermalis TaxID=923 RepID=UPI0020201D7D|nr:F0F1 ATP synthase subunit epsilon [Guyparkeria hydrothermalis]MCL7744452.1 F0F1 ATP synthase subunit epsilon [Guyparkeria hydrothermalis]